MSSTTADSVETLVAGRILPRVNLLPPEVHQARAMRRMQAAMVAGVAGLAVILGGVFAMQVHSANQASSELAKSKAINARLTVDKNKYAAVPQILNAINTAEDDRQLAMAQDVEWYRYLNDLAYVTPSGVWLTNLSVAFSNGATSSSPVVTQGMATVTIQGSAKTQPEVAAWLDALAKEHGWTDPYFSNSAVSQGNNGPIVQFSSTVQVTQAALSHRYDRKDG